MAPLILERVQRDRGRVVTCAFHADDLPDNLDWGLDADVSKLQWSFAKDRIVAHLRQAEDSVVIFEHPFARKGDTWLDVKSVPYVTCGEDVLFLINSSWADRERAEVALEEAGAQNELGVLGHHPRLSRKPPGSIPASLVAEVVAGAEAVLLRAFDAEGYLLWQP